MLPYHAGLHEAREQPPESIQKGSPFQGTRNIIVNMISAVPCLADNYAYLIPNGAGGALVVDPGEAEPVRVALAQRGLELAAILCTHHHRDHVGGNAQLWRPGVEVVAHATDRDRVPHLTRTVEDGELFEVAGVSLRALHVPGHTSGAVAYWMDDALFTGDTLFCAGCGRLFEGTAADLHASLCKLVATVPKDTIIYCGHEYTEKNLRFAAAVEPENPDVARRLARVREARRAGHFCAAATVAEELATNPFLRVDRPEVGRSVDLDDGQPERVFAALRRWKDDF